MDGRPRNGGQRRTELLEFRHLQNKAQAEEVEGNSKGSGRRRNAVGKLHLDPQRSSADPTGKAIAHRMGKGIIDKDQYGFNGGEIKDNKQLSMLAERTSPCPLRPRTKPAPQGGLRDQGHQHHRLLSHIFDGGILSQNINKNGGTHVPPFFIRYVLNTSKDSSYSVIGWQSLPH